MAQTRIAWLAIKKPVSGCRPPDGKEPNERRQGMIMHEATIYLLLGILLPPPPPRTAHHSPSNACMEEVNMFRSWLGRHKQNDSVLRFLPIILLPSR